MIRNLRNYSKLFVLLIGKPESRLGRIFEATGTLGFTALFIVQTVMNSNIEHYTQHQQTYGFIGLAGFGLGSVSFLGAAAIYLGKRAGHNGFYGQVSHMLRNLFLYLFIPSLIITVAVIVWAIATNQPGLRP